MSGNVQKNRTNTDWVCLGKFGAPRGLKGELRLQIFTGDIEDLKSRKNLCRGDDKLPVHLNRVQVIARGLVVKILGVNSRSDAEFITGDALYIRREDLPDIADEEFYFEDLVGLSVLDPEGSIMGRVKEVHNFGAGDIIEIALSTAIKGNGKNAMVPFRKEIVTAIDLEEGIMTVALEDWFANQLEAKGDDKE